MFGRTRIVAVGLLAIGTLALGAGTAQAQTPARAQTSPKALAASSGSVTAPSLRLPKPGHDDGDDFQAPRRVRTTAPSGAGQQIGGASAGGASAGGTSAGGAAAGGSAPGGAGAVPAPGPVSGLLAPVVGALHL